MNHIPESAVLSEELVEKTFSYLGDPLLHAKVRTPRLTSVQKRYLQRRFDFFYKRFAKSYLRYCQKTLFGMAKEEYLLCKKLDTGFALFEASLDFKLTYYDGRYLSLYFDRTESGGFGPVSRLRYGDTWDLETGTFADADTFIPGSGSLRRRVLAALEKANGGKVSKEVRKLMKDFSARRYYLTENGIVFFFQKDGLAPVELLIPLPPSETSQP